MGVSKGQLALGGVLLYAGTAGLAYKYFGSRPKTEEELELEQFRKQKQVGEGADVWQRNAPTYDKTIKVDEFLMGLPLLRRRVCKMAEGKVLEVSAGTGRNNSYYTAKATHVTISDSSASMLKMAQEKKQPKYSEVSYSVENVEHLPHADNSFDTVVDTFGLCSCTDPVAALKEMTRVCKPEGRILLLEHGQSRYDWLTKILDKHAPKHAEKWGCWWNRPILSLVQQANIEIEETTRWHFGTTYLIVGRPNKNAPAA